MNPKMIRASIDVTQLDKSLFVPGKKLNRIGKTPQYVNIELWINKDGPDEYGNSYFVKQSNYDKNVPSKDRVQLPILGNARIVIEGDDDGGSAPRRANSGPEKDIPTEDDVPF